MYMRACVYVHIVHIFDADSEWVPKQAEAPQALPSYHTNQHMKYQGPVHTTCVRVQLGCITADHYHCWSECK